MDDTKNISKENRQQKEKEGNIDLHLENVITSLREGIVLKDGIENYDPTEVQRKAFEARNLKAKEIIKDLLDEYENRMIKKNKLFLLDDKYRERMINKSICELKTQRGKFSLNINDIIKLAPGGWINDSLIDFFINYKVEKVKNEYFNVLDSFWYPYFLKNPKKVGSFKGDVFSREFLLIPIKLKDHWILIICCFLSSIKERIYSCGFLPKCNTKNDDLTSSSIQQETGFILYFDSMFSHSGINYEDIFENLRQYLSYKWNKHHGIEFVFDKENLPGHVVILPQQKNFYDCGCFTMLYASYFLKDHRKILRERQPNLDLRYWFSSDSSHIRLVFAEYFADKVKKYWEDIGDEESEEDSDIECIDVI